MSIISSMLTTVCEIYASEQPILNDVNRVPGLCDYATYGFCDRFPALKATPLALLGFRSVHPNRHEYWGHYANPDPYLSHTVCQLDTDIIVDFSYKQLDITYATSYRIQSLAEVKLEWLLLAHDYEKYIEPLLLIDTYLTQGTVDWKMKSSCETYTREQCLNEVLENYRRARRAYRQTQTNLKEGHLIATGTVDDNIHLRNFLTEWNILVAQPQPNPRSKV